MAKLINKVSGKAITTSGFSLGRSLVLKNLRHYTCGNKSKKMIPLIDRQAGGERRRASEREREKKGERDRDIETETERGRGEQIHS